MEERKLGRQKNTLEQRVSSLEKKLLTLYNRTYAVTARKDREKKSREQYYKSALERLRIIENRDYGNRHRIGILISSLKKGKAFVSLNHVEMMRFKKWLKDHPGRSK